MTKVRSMRIPEDLDHAIGYVSRLEKMEQSQTLRKLARLGFEIYTARAYRDGRVSLREASELLGLSLSETIDLFSEMGVKGNIRAENVLESLRSYPPENRGGEVREVPAETGMTQE